MIYLEMFRFLLPLVVTMVVLELGTQVLSGGMARMPQATETLASFGLAWGLVMLLTSPLWQTRQLGLVLVDGRQTHRRVLLFVLLSGLLLACLLALLALSPLGVWVVEDLHGVGGSLGLVAREALFWLIPIPLLKGVSLLYSGVLIRARRTGVVSYATFASIGASVLAVFLLLPAGFVRAHPIWLPILVTYAGLLSELTVTLWGSKRHTRHLRGEGGSQFSFLYVARFFWPLALIMVMQGLSRPLINLFVAREPGGAEALAVLTVLYSLALLPYAWVNEVRNLPPAFQDREGNLGHIRRFALGCGLVSFGLMVVLFWTPLREFILDTLLGLEPELVALAAMPLIISVFFPLTVMVRAYNHGIGLVEHRTKALAPSALARILALLLALIILPVFGVHGATRGMAALLFSFFVEALAVWWAISGKAAGPRRTKHLVDRAH